MYSTLNIMEQYVLWDFESKTKISKKSFSMTKKEADEKNYAFALNGVNKRYVLASHLLSKFAEYKG